MPKEYIDREALIQTLNKEGIQYNADVNYFIMNAPTADVVEVVHGEWIYHDCVSTYDGTESGYSCSVCCVFITEDEFDMPGCYTDFCGSCGAKMDGKNQL